MGSSAGTEEEPDAGVGQRVHEGDREAIAKLCGDFCDPAYAYCFEAVGDDEREAAVEEAFRSFLGMLAKRPVSDDHLPGALLRSVLLACAGRMRLEDGPNPDDGFDCELTPRLLAGSPNVPASAETQSRLGRHLESCERCQALRARLERAEQALRRAPAAVAPSELRARMLEAAGAAPEAGDDRRPEAVEGGPPGEAASAWLPPGWALPRERTREDSDRRPDSQTAQAPPAQAAEEVGSPERESLSEPEAPEPDPSEPDPEHAAFEADPSASQWLPAGWQNDGKKERGSTGPTPHGVEEGGGEEETRAWEVAEEEPPQEEETHQDEGEPTEALTEPAPPWDTREANESEPVAAVDTEAAQPAPLDSALGPKRRWRSPTFLLAGFGALMIVGVTVAAVLLAGSSDDKQPRRTTAQPPPKPKTATDKVRLPARAGKTPAARPGLRALSLAGARARDYDPLGTGGENSAEAPTVIDGKISTRWTTEAYFPGDLRKPGVGIYVALQSPKQAQALELTTPTPGWDVQVYGAASGPPPRFPASGWRRLGASTNVGKRSRIKLVGGGAFRYYLVWVIDLPDALTQIEIAELRLLARPRA